MASSWRLEKEGRRGFLRITGGGAFVGGALRKKGRKASRLHCSRFHSGEKAEGGKRKTMTFPWGQGKRAAYPLPLIKARVPSLLQKKRERIVPLDSGIEKRRKRKGRRTLLLL